MLSKNKEIIPNFSLFSLQSWEIKTMLFAKVNFLLIVDIDQNWCRLSQTNMEVPQ